jgi:hypothetical protein
MDFDLPAAGRRYAEINNNIARLEAEINDIRLRLNNINEALSAFNLEQINSGSLPNEIRITGFNEISGQAGLIILEINRALLLLQNTRLAFEFGTQSRNDLVNAENNLKALLFRYEAEAETLEHTLLLRLLDLENLRLSRETIQDLLRDFRNNAVVRAPAAGTVIRLDAERGRFFPENALLISIGVGNEFIVECVISLDNNFVNQGDICELGNSSHTLRGVVRRIIPAANGKTVMIAIVSDEVSEGETFNVIFEKNSASSFTLVPSNAINRDNDGYFVFQIRRRRGIMGEEYFVERLNIFIGDSDHQNTAVIRGITFFDPIVLVSNPKKPGGFF